MQSYETNKKPNPRYVGLTKEQQARQISSDAISSWQKSIQLFVDGLDKDDVQTNWYHYTLWVPSLIQNAIEGALYGIAGLINTGGQIVSEANNLFMRMLDSDNQNTAAAELEYFKTDWSMKLLEGFSSTAISAFAQLGRAVNIDPDWAFDEETGLIPRIAEKADRVRLLSGITHDGAHGNREDFQKYFDEIKNSDMVEAPDFGVASEEEITTYENEIGKMARTRLIEENYLESSRNIVEGSTELNRWLSQDVIQPTISGLFLGLDKEMDKHFGDHGLYQFTSQSFQSIGNIMVSWGLAAVGAKYGVPPAIPKMYFGASVYGRSHAEAMQNGASINDAHVFAVGRTAAEVLAQKMGGLKTVPFTPKILRDSMGRLMDTSFSKMLKDVFIEGLEEAVIELGRGGQYYYANERTMDHIETNAELAKSVMFSFMAGAMASAVLGGGRNLYLQTTLPHQVAKHAQSFKIDVEKYGQAFAVEKFQTSLNKIVDHLNDPRAKSYKKNKHGADYIGVLSEAEKITWLNKTDLKRFINYDTENNQFVLKSDLKLDSDIFDNKIDGEIIVSKDFAISENVAGRELKIDDGTEIVKPLTKEKLTDAGRAALAQANKDMDSAPVVIYSSKSKTDGFYGTNGVIYVNQNGLSVEQAIATVVLHEMTHKIQTEAPQVYEAMMKNIDKLIEVTVNDNNEIDVVVKSKELDVFLESKGYKDSILASLNYYLTATKDTVTALEMARNEIAPFFIEAILDGSQANSSLTMKNQKLVRRVLKHIKGNKHLQSIAKENKTLGNQLKKIRNAFDKGVRQVGIQDRSISFFVNNAMGQKSFSDIVNWDYLKTEFDIDRTDENEETIMLSIFSGFDQETGDIFIYGIKDEAIRIPNGKLFQDVTNIQPKKISQPNYNEIYRNIEVHPTKYRNKYRRLLWEFVEVQNEIIDMIIQENNSNVKASEELWRPYQERASMADLIHNKLDRKSPFVKPNHVAFMRELLAIDTYNENEYNFRKRNTKDVQTLEARASSNAIQKHVRYFNNETGFVGWRNRSYSINRQSSAVWNFEVKANKTSFETAEGLKNAIELVSSTKFPGEFTFSYNIINVLGDETNSYYRSSELGKDVEMLQTEFGENVLVQNLKFDQDSKTYIEIHATPTEKIINENVRKLESRMYETDSKEPTKIYSLDSEGNAITPFTKQRFRNSLVRDSNGSLRVLHHGTQRAWFSQFGSQSRTLGTSTVSKETFGDNEVHFFTTERNVAEFYSNTNESVPIEVTQKYDTIKQLVEALHSIEGEAFEQMTVLRHEGKYQLVQVSENIDLEIQRPTQKDIEWFIAEYDTRDSLLKKAFEDILIHDNIISSDNTAGNYSVYLNIQNPYGIDAENADFNNIIDPDGPGTPETTNEIINRVIEMNKNDGTEYDGVIFENINDPSQSDVYVTIKSQDQIQIVNREESVSPRNVTNQFIEDVFTFFTDQRILQGNQFLTREGLNVYEVTPEKMVLPKNYDINNVIVGMPNFEKNNALNAINDSTKFSSIVAFALPIFWKEGYKHQSKVADHMKLIFNKPYNPGVKLLNYYPGKATKLVGQVWVRKDDTRFKTMPDLRKTHADPIKHKDFQFYKLDRSEHFEAYKNFDFDFAVQNKGPATDFMEKITDFNSLDKTKNYILIKSQGPKVLETLNSINFNELALYGSDISIGFTGTDLIRAYTEQKNKTVMPKKVQNTELTPQDHAYIQEAVGNIDVSKFFKKDARGNYVLKNEKMVKSQKRSDVIQINNKFYKTKDYAMSVRREHQNNFNLSTDVEFVKISELSQHQNIVFKMFESMDISFIFYRETDGKDEALGFSSRNKNSNVVFLNADFIGNSSSIGESTKRNLVTLIHEEMHEMFKFNESKAIEFGKKLSKILFVEENGAYKATEVLEAIIKTDYVNEGTFLKYLASYSEMKNVKTLNDLNDILVKGYSKKTQVSPNELIAQMVGVLFSDENVINKIFINEDGSTNHNSSISAYNLYTTLIKNANQNVRIYLEDAFKNFEVLRQEYTSEIGKLFNKSERYTLKELNNFIKIFTDGNYTTKNKLLNAYFKEAAQKQSGPAHETMNNLIFIADQFSKIFKDNVDNFHSLKKEFDFFKHQVDYVLTKDQTATFLKSEPFRNFENIVKFFGKKGKTAKVSQLFDTSNVTDAQVFRINEHFNQMYDLFEAMSFSYAAIDPKLLRYFAMPHEHDIESSINDILTIINDLSNDIHDVNNDTGEVAQINFKPYIDAVVKFINSGDALSTDKSIDTKTLRMIQNKMEKNYAFEMSEIYNNIISRTKAVLKQFESSRLQKISPFHAEIQKIASEIYNFAELLNEHKFDFHLGQNVTKQKFVNVLNELIKTIENSNRIPDNIKEILLNDYMRNVHIQTAVLWNDKTILTNRYSDQVYQIQTLESLAPGGVKPKAFSQNLGAILKAFETKYTNIFSDHTKTTVEVVQQATQEIDDLPDTIQTKIVSKNMRLMTSQDFMDFFVTVTKGKVEFFNQVYQKYLEASYENIEKLADFTSDYETFHRENKETIKHLHDSVELDSSYLVNMESQDQYIKAKQEAHQTMKKQKEILKNIKENISDIRKEIAEHRLMIKRAQQIIQKGSSNVLLVDAQNKIIKEQRKLITEKQKVLKQNNNQLKIEKQSLDTVRSEEFLIKESLIKQSSSENYQNSKMTFGELINLYFVLKREIEMAENYNQGDKTIAPTNHFGLGNYIEVYDVLEAAQKGYQHAKNTMKIVAINESKENLLNYIEGLIQSDADQTVIDFVYKRMNKDYYNVNENYKKQTQVDLPRQHTYMPYQMRDGNIVREYKLKSVHQHNQGVPDSMTKQTMHHASNPLVITHVLDVVEMSAKRAALFSYEAFITDFQAAMETRSDSTGPSLTLKQKLSTQGNKMGDNNKYYDGVELATRKIIEYGDPDESWGEKTVRKTTGLGVGATVALNIPMSLKQLPTITTTLIKMGRPDLAVKMTQNVLLSLGKSKYRSWLMSREQGEGNSQVYMRAKQGNIVSLIDNMPLGMLRGITSTTRQISQSLGYLVGRFDNATLVGAFKTFVDDYRSQNPNATEAEAYQYGNEQLNEMFLWGIANFNPAFRSPFSASKRVLERVVGRFMSENVLQYSSMVKHIALWSNNRDVGSLKELLKHFSALMVSAFLSSVVNLFAGSARGYTDLKGDGVAYELFVNQMLWNNMMGVIPYANQVTGMLQWEMPSRNDAGQLNMGLRTGFQFNVPFYDDIFKMVETIASLQNGQNTERKILRIFEHLGQMTGVPVRNAVRTSRSLANIFSPTGAKQILAINQFFDSTTDQAALNQAVAKGNTGKINTYIEKVYDNEPVRNEIARLLVNNPEARIQIYSDPFFRTQMPDGSYKRHDIPKNLQIHYNKMSQNALRALINRFEYRVLSDEEKIKTIQRVLNYYNRQLRNDVLGERVELMQMIDVINNSLKYSKA